jgi:hypothetical protein
VVDAFALAQTAENLLLFLVPLGGNDDGDCLADGLFGSETKEALRPGVPSADGPIEVLGDDGVVGALNDGGKPRSGIL